jgi:hypothetical protein
MAANPKSRSSIEGLASASGVIAVTPSDSTAIATLPRALYVGGAGNIAVLMEDDSTATFSSVPAGTLLPIRVKRVNSTNTTATLILALI